MVNRQAFPRARSFMGETPRSKWPALLALALGLAACSGGGESEDDPAELFGAPVTSIARIGDDGEVLGVGVVIPVKGFEDATSDHGSHGEFFLEMLPEVRDKTVVQHLRINWLSGGHGPTPYGEPHFDLHFYRGTKAEIDAIDCSDTTPFPPEVVPTGYETPELCVPEMGYHAWPSEDLQGSDFSASMILGYYGKKMVFLEPMVTRARFLQRESFELTIARPKSTGGGATLFPSHVDATYDATTEAFTIEFNQFAPID